MSKRPLVVGVMGGGSATPEALEKAYRLGRLIADEGWILLNGGRNAGIMDASAKGAREAGGLTVGILPDESDTGVSEHILIPVFTGMGNARNCINVLSSHVVVACAGGAGTLSEIALALKTGKPVILLDFDVLDFFEPHSHPETLFPAAEPEQVIRIIKERLFPRGPAI